MRRLLAKMKRSGPVQATQYSRNDAPADTPSDHPGSAPTVLPRTESEQAQIVEKEESTGPDRIQHLPPEVRRHLLSVLTLPDLQSLVRASPVLHAQYVNDRTYILCRSLESTLRGATVDAYAVQRLTSMSTTERDVPKFLRKLYSQPVKSLVGNVSEDEIVNMVAFHKSVNAVIPLFLEWALEEEGRKPSPTETLRLHRAIYRFQLVCLVASPSNALGRRVKATSLRAIVDMFEPWEVEELFSFYQFVEEVHGKKIHKIRWSIPEDMNIDVDFLTWNFPYIDPVARGYAAGVALRGLPMLLHVLKLDYDQLLLTIQQNIVLVDVLLSCEKRDSPMSDDEQTLRCAHKPNKRDRMMADRRPLPFRGDVEPDGQLGVDQLPPIAWTMIWGGTYSSLYGFYTSNDLRRWGYVFWDEATIVALQGERVLRVQWEQNWHGHDPRDTVRVSLPS